MHRLYTGIKDTELRDLKMRRALEAKAQRLTFWVDSPKETPREEQLGVVSVDDTTCRGWLGFSM